MYLKGNWIPYERAMIEMYGREQVEEFKKLADVTVKYTVSELQEIEAVYKAKVAELLTHGLLPSTMKGHHD
jgi:major membrane immunogen (membrane-anchored lipoprotein)